MVCLGLRSVMATVLSLWLGVLVCLLGCAKPAAAVSMEQRQLSGMSVCPERNEQADDSCCQHGRSGGSEKDNHDAKSCCPSETALTQKNGLAAPPICIHIFALILPNFDLSEFNSTQNAVPALCCSGRDILRQVHVLRI